MKRSAIVCIAVTALLLVSFQGFGYGNPDRALERTLSVNLGLWRAISAQVTYPNNTSEKYKYEDPDNLISVGGKLWFYQSKFGLGIDGILLDSQDLSYESGTYGGVTYPDGGTATLSQWLVDLDLYYRMPLSPTFLAVGGIGLTYNYFNAGGHPYYQDQKDLAGYNVKAGAEIFLGENLSASGMFTWHYFNAGATIADSTIDGDMEVRLFSFGIAANLYL